MRKLFASAVIGAALLAVIGSASASAAEPTKFCKANEAHCSALNTYSTSTTFSASGTLTLNSKLYKLSCSATMSGKLGETVGDPARGTASTALSGCSMGGGEKCNAYGWTSPTSTEAVGSGYGWLTLDAISIQYNCGELFNCLYTASAARTSVVRGGAGVAAVEFHEVALTTHGTGCPTSTLSGKLYFNYPLPLYVTN
jgi:hypothetical protein